MNIKVLAISAAAVCAFVVARNDAAETERLRLVQSQSTPGQLEMQRSGPALPTLPDRDERPSGPTLDTGRGLDMGRGLDVNRRAVPGRRPAVSDGGRNFEFGAGVRKEGDASGSKLTPER